MKKAIIVFFILAVLGGNTVSAQGVDGIVKRVKADYAAVNSKKLKSRVISIAEGAFAEDCRIVTSEVTFYALAGGSTEKIKRWLAADAVEGTTEYYYKDGKLFFIFSKQEYFPPTEGAGKQVTELRIYLDRGKPVKYISSQGDVYPTMNFDTEVQEGNALLKAKTKEQVQEALCAAK